MTYRNTGEYSTDIQIDNAQKGLEVMLSANVMITVIFGLFICYHIFASRYEIRNLKNITKGRSYQNVDDAPCPISVKEFAVMITDVQTDYSKSEGNINDDIRNVFGKY